MSGEPAVESPIMGVVGQDAPYFLAWSIAAAAHIQQTPHSFRIAVLCAQPLSGAAI